MRINYNEMQFIENNEDYLGSEFCEDGQAYVERKRTADLSYLLDMIMKNDLDEIECKILEETVMGDSSAKEIAEKYSIEPSKVYRIRKKALKKVKGLLKYAVIYQRDCVSERLLPIELKKIMTLSVLKASPAVSLSHRIRKLMAKENITEDDICSALGTEKDRISEIVSGKKLPDADELLSLSLFFQTSTDYLLKGDIL